ncbi:antirestriction protein ArdA, partial [Pseudoclavibacter alba]
TNRPLLTAAVWIGCVNCHNKGKRVGRWIPAALAECVTTEHLHPDTRALTSKVPDLACHTFWCFETANLPRNEEMSPRSAAAWAMNLHRTPEELRAAYTAWVHTYDIDDPEQATPELFKTVYLGRYATTDLTDELRNTCSSAEADEDSMYLFLD